MICRRTFVLLLILLALGSGCRRDKKVERQLAAAHRPRLSVVCATLPVYVMARNIIGDAEGLSLNLLISPQIGCPHDYAMTPTQAALLEKADVLILNGLGLEAFLTGSPALHRADLRIIVASETIDSIASWDDRAIIYPVLLSESEHGHQHDEAMNNTNPHAWVSPFQAAKMTLAIAWHLAQIDSARAANYLSNAQAYAARLDSLGQALRDLVAHAPNRRIVTFHNAFDYFARDLGLAIVDVIEAEPGVAPSARALDELAQRIKEADAVAIFAEPQYNDKLARVLGAETGVPVFALDPAAGSADDVEGILVVDSYLRTMRSNLLVLEKALFAPRSP